MKNIINITTEGEQLVSSTDDGTNTLYINDNEIASSNWIGSGNYTTTVNGHAITIKKCTDLNGNCQLVKLSDYNYEMRKTALAGQLQMLNYIYPVGSYYETSDASFDPNVVWGGTWVKLAHNTLLTSLTYKPNGSTTAIGNITIPEDGYYMFIVSWSNGKPLFAGLSTDTQNSPTQVIYDGVDSGGSYNVVMYMTAGVKKVWVRAQSASANNTFYVYKVNYVNDQINRWHRTA